MKYSVQDYARAFVKALENQNVDRGAALENFRALVSRNGDEARLFAIARAAARLARAKEGIREVVIESARPLTKAQEDAVRAVIRPGDALEKKIDPGAIAGIKIIVNEEMQFDGTMKAKLSKLFSL